MRNRDASGRPKPDILADARRIYAANVAPGDFVVGVQMRTQKRTRLHPPVRCASAAEPHDLERGLPKR